MSIGLIINADDFGITSGVSRGICDLMEEGAISETSVMALGRDVERSLRERGRGAIGGRAGVHLQITGGSPLTGGRSITDPTTGELFPHPLPGPIDPIDVYVEWRAQIDRVGELLGCSPSHLDSHHGYHRKPEFAEIYGALAQEYGLPVRAGAPLEPIAGIRSPDRTLREWTTKGLEAEQLAQMVESLRLRSGQVAEVVTHPGYSDGVLRDISTLADMREHELSELRRLGPLRETQGWRLTTFRDLTGGSSG